jgi:hypothetical protein
VLGHDQTFQRLSALSMTKREAQGDADRIFRRRNGPSNQLVGADRTRCALRLSRRRRRRGRGEGAAERRRARPSGRAANSASVLGSAAAFAEPDRARAPRSRRLRAGAKVRSQGDARKKFPAEKLLSTENPRPRDYRRPSCAAARRGPAKHCCTRCDNAFRLGSGTTLRASAKNCCSWSQQFFCLLLSPPPPAAG